jgi:hypothetical protein
MKHITNKPMAQGDLLIIPVKKVPAKASPAKAEGQYYIVGHSETGHHHVIERARAEVFEAADDAFCAWIKTLDKPADIEHQRDFDTHETIRLEPNKVYEVRRQREYAPEGWRRAAD